MMSTIQYVAVCFMMLCVSSPCVFHRPVCFIGLCVSSPCVFHRSIPCSASNNACPSPPLGPSQHGPRLRPSLHPLRIRRGFGTYKFQTKPTLKRGRPSSNMLLTMLDKHNSILNKVPTVWYSINARKVKRNPTELYNTPSYQTRLQNNRHK